MENNNTFQREERFIVIKRKHLGDKEPFLRAFLAEEDIGTVECVVVESDWPEYETVWQMIEDRCGQCCDNVPMGDHIRPVAILHARNTQPEGEPT